MNQSRTLEPLFNGGGDIPPEYPPVAYGGDRGDDSNPQHMDKARCQVALILAACRLRCTYEQIFCTKRGYYAGLDIEAGRFKQAAKTLDSLNGLDLKHYKPEGC